MGELSQRQKENGGTPAAVFPRDIFVRSSAARAPRIRSDGPSALPGQAPRSLRKRKRRHSGRRFPPRHLFALKRRAGSSHSLGRPVGLAGAGAPEFAQKKTAALRRRFPPRKRWLCWPASLAPRGRITTLSY